MPTASLSLLDQVGAMPGAPGAVGRTRCRSSRASSGARSCRRRAAAGGAPSRRLVPATGTRGRATRPSAGPHVPRLVERGGDREIEDAVDDPPGGLDPVLAGEQRSGPLGSRRRSGAGRAAAGPAVVGGVQLDRLADHGLAGLLGPRAERDRHVGRQPEPEVVGIAAAPTRRRRSTAAASARRGPRSP